LLLPVSIASLATIVQYRSSQSEMTAVASMNDPLWRRTVNAKQAKREAAYGRNVLNESIA